MNYSWTRMCGQSADLNIHGDNNKISISQLTNNQMGFTSGQGILPSCVILDQVAQAAPLIRYTP
jgi:hypothetical protein